MEMTKFQEGSGKSSSFFFFTSNKYFVVKTLKFKEYRMLYRRNILEKYFHHLQKNPKSLLARFYGVFKVKIQYMEPI